VSGPSYTDTDWDVAASVRREMKSFSSNITKRFIRAIITVCDYEYSTVRACVAKKR